MALSATEDPVLLGTLGALERGGFAAEIWDEDWRVAGMTDDYVRAATHGDPEVELGVGLAALSDETMAVRGRWPGGPVIESLAEAWQRAIGYYASTGADVEALRAGSAPGLAGLFRDVTPVPMPSLWIERVQIRFGTGFIHNDICCVRLNREDGTFAGVASVLKPALRGAVLAMLALGDERLFERQLRLTRPTRQPAAILFADLEGSTALSRRMSAADYFALLRRLIHRIDTCVVEAGGIVGKHAGDGVTAFFSPVMPDPSPPRRLRPFGWRGSCPAMPGLRRGAVASTRTTWSCASGCTSARRSRSDSCSPQDVRT